MTGTRFDPRTLAGLRRRIDRLDRRLVAALARRQRLIEAVALVKLHPDAVRDPERVAQVLANVLEAAAGARLCPETARAVWDVLVECSAAHQVDWLRNRGRGAGARTADRGGG